MINVEKLIEQLEAWNEQHLSVVCGNGHFACDYLCENEDCIVVRAATALSTLQAENTQLRAELKQVKAERDALIDDFVDYVTGGVPNPAIFCKNRCDKCTDMRGWCTGKNCKGFYPSGASGQKED